MTCSLGGVASPDDTGYPWHRNQRLAFPEAHIGCLLKCRELCTPDDRPFAEDDVAMSDVRLGQRPRLITETENLERSIAAVPQVRL
jgi:hypothetical protein